MFPVETISAKMLDYYVDRRDTLIIDLREKESYMHSHVKGAVNTGNFCRNDIHKHGRRIYSLSKRKNIGSVLRQGRGKPSACKAACKAWVLYQVCYRRFWSISGKKSCNFAISMIRCKRKNTNRYIFRLFQKSICRHTYCANKLISRTILRLNFLFPRCRRSP